MRDLAPMFGVTYQTAKNKVMAGTFPVPTYKLGRRIVADKEVVYAWFAARRERGLAVVRDSTAG